MPDLTAIEAKVGQELVKTREYNVERDRLETAVGAMNPPSSALWKHDLANEEADAMRDELLALIERLAGERDEERRLRKNAGAAAVLAIEIKDKAEAALAAMRSLLEETEEVKNQMRAELAAAREEREGITRQYEAEMQKSIAAEAALASERRSWDLASNKVYELRAELAAAQSPTNRGIGDSDIAELIRERDRLREELVAARDFIDRITALAERHDKGDLLSIIAECRHWHVLARYQPADEPPTSGGE